jgi:hypothetical protein
MNTDEDRKDAEVVAAADSTPTEAKQPEQKKDDEIDLLPA